jgi:cellulase
MLTISIANLHFVRSIASNWKRGRDFAGWGCISRSIPVSSSSRHHRRRTLIHSAYRYTDPGIVYNVCVPTHHMHYMDLHPQQIYSSTAGQQYTIPGPAVWTAAAASPSPPDYGQPIGYTTAQPWYTWIGSGFSDVTLATSLTVGTGTQTAVYAYTPSWSTVHRVPSAAIASFAASYRIPADVPQITAPPEP